MMSHDEANDLLAVFALDAVDSDEHEEIEAHLAVCPRCRAELDAHRDVAAALGNSVESLPEGLWSSIASRLVIGTNEEAPPMPSLSRADTSDEPVGSFRTPRHTARPRASRGRLLSVASLALASAATAVVLGVNLVDANNQVAHLQGAIGETAHTAVLAALETPGHKVVNLKGASGHQLAEFVVLPSGQGYLVESHLPALSSKETYQLWGVVDGQTISLGLLGKSPHLVTFTLAGSPKEWRLGITAEPTGGSVVPSGAMLASGPV
jgi:Anti-sigma-K factor rskA/Putative zinc-finger